MSNYERDFEIYTEVVELGKTKTEVARNFGISPRSVGRAIERHLNAVKPEDQETGEYNVILSKESITITYTDAGVHDSVYADKSHPRWNDVSEMIWANRASQESAKTAFEILSIKRQIENFQLDDVLVDVNRGVVLFENEPVPHELSDRIIMAAENEDKNEMVGLVKFTNKMMNNPSNRVTQNLYQFLAASDIKIDEEGDVICYKKVDRNYRDIYTGKFDNSIGSVVQVNRNKVDEDADRTCSYGLHVCSKHYLDFYGSTERNTDIVVRVKVDPKDFVAIPSDYSFSKARVCKYEVLGRV